MLTDQPLWVILHKLKTSGRIVKWSVELRKFDIEYHPRGVIKRQAVANFNTEYTHKPEDEATT